MKKTQKSDPVPRGTKSKVKKDPWGVPTRLREDTIKLVNKLDPKGRTNFNQKIFLLLKELDNRRKNAEMPNDGKFPKESDPI